MTLRLLTRSSYNSHPIIVVKKATSFSVKPCCIINIVLVALRIFSSLYNTWNSNSHVRMRFVFFFGINVTSLQHSTLKLKCNLVTAFDTQRVKKMVRVTYHIPYIIHRVRGEMFT